MTSLLSSAYRQGAIRDIRQRIYRRELERYGSDMIADVEQHFHLDSEYVLEVIRAELSDMYKYWLCMELIRLCTTELNISPTILHSHLVRIWTAFEREHHLTSEGFRRLNELHRITRLFLMAPLITIYVFSGSNKIIKAFYF